MLLAVAIVLLATGLPAYAVLMGVASLFAAVGVLAGGLQFPLLTARPRRLPWLAGTRPPRGPAALRLHGRVAQSPAARRPAVPLRRGARSSQRRRAGVGDPGAGRAAGADERLGRRQRRHAVTERRPQARGARRARCREHG